MAEASPESIQRLIDNSKRIDHFNTIVHHIFVDRVFDGVDANGN